MVSETAAMMAAYWAETKGMRRAETTAGRSAAKRGVLKAVTTVDQ